MKKLDDLRDRAQDELEALDSRVDDARVSLKELWADHPVFRGVVVVAGAVVLVLLVLLGVVAAG